MPSLLTGLLLAVALSVYPLLGLYSRLVVLGAFRSPALPVSHFASETFVIPEIQQAEDFAYHQPSGLIFFLGQGDPSSRLSWYPALNILDNPAKATTADGQIWALDPKNWKPKRVPITNWNAPFVTHGMDIHIPSNDPNTFYLHAVNHRPPANGVPGPTDSVVEVFKVDLSAFTATHLKTVSHSTIHTPNDILSLGPYEFLVTNDHANVDGLLRSAEEILTLQLASHTTLIHVNAATGVEAKVVKTGIHSANGLGRDASGNIVLMSAASGRLAILDDQYAVKTSTFFDTTLDNPTYYADPAATTTSDASAHVLAGIMTAVDIRDHARDPKFNFRSVIWLARERNGVWEKKKLLEDDGEWLNFATTAMLLPITDTGSKKKEAWVVATGVLARGVSVGRVDLTEWASGHGLPKNKA